MSDSEYPVTVAVSRPDGSIEQVRIGTAVKAGEGFSLSLGELALGAPVPRRAASNGARAAAPGGGPVFPNYGRSKGAPIFGATEQDLEYYAAGAKRSLADPSKARFHDKERQLLAAIEAEIARQGGGGGGSSAGGFGEEPPPPSDEDAPF
ncbi:MAG: hypothetical protein ACT4TC_02535 [Myxococcaceae bacterium]